MVDKTRFTWVKRNKIMVCNENDCPDINQTLQFGCTSLSTKFIALRTHSCMPLKQIILTKFLGYHLITAE